MKQHKRTTVTVLHSGVQADQSYHDQLTVHLSLLQREGLIEQWSDQQIPPGSDRAQTISQAIRSADILLLLVSSDFLALDTCYQEGTQHAVVRHRAGAARVIPIIVRPCDWQHSPLGSLRPLPHNGEPISTLDNQDKAFLSIVQDLRVLITQQRFPPAPQSRVPRQNRQRLLHRVRSFWIAGILEQSLHGAVLLALGLKEQPDAVANPWRLVLQESEHVRPPLPAGTRIAEVYDDAGGELLILGEPGSGKTTLLLELARDLLKRAEQEQDHPIPAVFNLSSWTRKQQSLATWLIEELEEKYQVPRKIGSGWINTDQILPLLDGLDEVDASFRTACMQAINEYHQAHNLIPLVVCCRVNEYISQANRLTLYRAITIQPLKTEQVNEYLVCIGEQVASLRIAFQNDPILQELATTPLMLTILILTYEGSSLEGIAGSVSTEIRQQQIFATYTQRMLRRRSMNPRFPDQQTIRCLSWLARQMKQRSQTLFSIERLQIDWLSKSRQGQLYTSLAVGLFCLLFNLCVDGTLYGILDGLLTASFKTVVFILLNGLLFGWLVEREMKIKEGLFRAVLFAQLLGNRVNYGLFSGLLTGIFIGFLKGPNAGLINGLLTGLFLGSLGKLDKKIQPAETIAWSWESVLRNAMKILIGGLCIGFFYGFITAFPLLPDMSIFLSTLFFGLGIGLVIGLVFMLIGGFSGSMLDTEKIEKPNQGIWNSFDNSVRLGLLSGLAFGLVFFIAYSLVIYQVFNIGNAVYFPPNSGLIYGIADGLTVASLIWLINGGLACIQHLVLRFLLWQTGCIPWNYPCFLDYASERILLRKVGGSYIFVHRLLLEYFATLDEPVSAKGTSPKGRE